MTDIAYKCKCGGRVWYIRDGDIECDSCGLNITRPAARLWSVEDFNEIVEAGEFDLDHIDTQRPPPNPR